ncbi:hypothetical protein B0T10DRAFT_457552 [Thelonectria olida]|uniref:Uncharacterized protein n=1 Tax=Thelonectria olida TaxID=1576542 RepID=A0A9P8W834_9HYPO|nr:hypothetical protein B0T10DRAFT_457552 [Thelonectria olida]
MNGLSKGGFKHMIGAGGKMQSQHVRLCAIRNMELLSEHGFELFWAKWRKGYHQHGYYLSNMAVLCPDLLGNGGVLVMHGDELLGGCVTYTQTTTNKRNVMQTGLTSASKFAKQQLVPSEGLWWLPRDPRVDWLVFLKLTVRGRIRLMDGSAMIDMGHENLDGLNDMEPSHALVAGEPRDGWARRANQERRMSTDGSKTEHLRGSGGS